MERFSDFSGGEHLCKQLAQGSKKRAFLLVGDGRLTCSSSIAVQTMTSLTGVNVIQVSLKTTFKLLGRGVLSMLVLTQFQSSIIKVSDKVPFMSEWNMY